MNSSAIQLTQNIICILLCIFDSPEPGIASAIEKMQDEFGYEVLRLRNLLGLLQKKCQIFYSLVGREELAICRRLVELGMEFPNEIGPRPHTCNHFPITHRVIFNDLAARMGVVGTCSAEGPVVSLTAYDEKFLRTMKIAV